MFRSRHVPFRPFEGLDQMYFTSKRIIFIVFFFVFYSGSAFSQSDFDLFLKNSGQYQDVIIDRILSVDTLVLKEALGEKGEVIRLIGLQAPTTPKSKTKKIDRDEHGFTKKEPVSPMTPIEEKAFEFVQELLEGKHVRLEFDSDKKGEKYATLAYVFLNENGTFVNTEILRHGFAHLRIRPPNTKYAKELREAYKEARREKRGLQGE